MDPILPWVPKSIEHMSQSALYGRPPATDNDFWIVKAMLFQMGLVDADPTKGLPLKQFPPPNDESKAGSIIAGVTISIFLVLSITTTRIVARKLISTSSLGWDDALIVVAAVRVILSSYRLAFCSFRIAGGHLVVRHSRRYGSPWRSRQASFRSHVHRILLVCSCE